MQGKRAGERGIPGEAKGTSSESSLLGSSQRSLSLLCKSSQTIEKYYLLTIQGYRKLSHHVILFGVICITESMEDLGTGQDHKSGTLLDTAHTASKLCIKESSRDLCLIQAVGSGLKVQAPVGTTMFFVSHLISPSGGD